MTTLEHSNRSDHHPTFVRMQHPETAKNIHVFLNGDQYSTGRKFVINRKYISNFDGFLNQVTSGMKAPFGAIRNVYTPQYGHRVYDLDQLKSGMQVVAGGVEKFRKLEYNEIGKRKQPKKRNYLDIKLRNSRINVSARWRKHTKGPCQIYVYGNGDINAPAMRTLIIPRLMQTWDLVLREITEKISLRTGQAVRKLYDMDFRLILNPAQLESGHYYIAVGTERLKKYPYGELHKMQSPLPRKSSRQPLPPIQKTSKSKTQGESYTKMFAQKKRQKEQEEETIVMKASAATGYRPIKMKTNRSQKSPGPPKHEGESVFHAKPVKVKRVGGREATATSDVHPSSEENDGVFRVTSSHIKADEVEEDEETKLDLPIDQRPADEVEEEHLPSDQKISDDDVSERQKLTDGESEVIDPDLPSSERSLVKSTVDQHLDSVEDTSAKEPLTTDLEEASTENATSNASEMENQNDTQSTASTSTPTSEKVSEDEMNGSDITKTLSTNLNESQITTEFVPEGDPQTLIGNEEFSVLETTSNDDAEEEDSQETSAHLENEVEEGEVSVLEATSNEDGATEEEDSRETSAHIETEVEEGEVSVLEATSNEDGATEEEDSRETSAHIETEVEEGEVSVLEATSNEDGETEEEDSRETSALVETEVEEGEVSVLEATSNEDGETEEEDSREASAHLDNEVEEEQFEDQSAINSQEHVSLHQSPASLISLEEKEDEKSQLLVEKKSNEEKTNLQNSSQPETESVHISKNNDAAKFEDDSDDLEKSSDTPSDNTFTVSEPTEVESSSKSLTVVPDISSVDIHQAGPTPQPKSEQTALMIKA